MGMRFFFSLFVCLFFSFLPLGCVGKGEVCVVKVSKKEWARFLQHHHTLSLKAMTRTHPNQSLNTIISLIFPRSNLSRSVTIKENAEESIETNSGFNWSWTYAPLPPCPPPPSPPSLIRYNYLMSHKATNKEHCRFFIPTEECDHNQVMIHLIAWLVT